MKPVWKVVGWVGGALGAAVAGAAVAQTAKVSHERKHASDSLADEPLGQLRPDRESTVAADDGVPISVEEVDPGDGGEPDITVVLVHGFALDRRCWHFQRRDLDELIDPRVHQVLYDQRSHGRSGRSTAESSTIDQLAHDLDAVIRSVVPDGPLVLVGHSMGGMTIMALAEAQPGALRRTGARRRVDRHGRRCGGRRGTAEVRAVAVQPGDAGTSAGSRAAARSRRVGA